MSNFGLNLDKTGFGEVKVESESPITQVSAHLGLLTGVLGVIDSASSGNADITDGMFTCSTGTASDGLSAILTRRQAAYRPGQGLVAKFTAKFSTGVANSQQSAGFITSENSFTFGYDGTEFGIFHGFDGVDEHQELALTGTGAGNATVTVDGTPYTVAITNSSPEENAYEIAESMSTQLPSYLFTSNQNEVVAISLIPGPAGAFAYTGPGTSAGTWTQLAAGADTQTTFIPQADWSVDTRISSDPDINLNPQKGNVYRIQFKYLGFGGVNFYVEDKVSGEFVLVHRFEFANDLDKPNVSYPTFRVGWLALNEGNTTDVIVQGASASAFVEGKINRDAPPRGDSSFNLSVGSSPTNLISFRNRVAFGTTLNRVDVFPELVNGWCDTIKAAIYEILIDPVFADPVIWEYIDKDNSVVEVTKTDVGVSGGLVVGEAVITNGSNTPIRLNITSNSETVVVPGSVICLAGRMVTGSSSDCQAAATFQEDF